MNLYYRIFMIQLLLTLGATNSIKGKIAGGYDAKPHSNPYVVSLQTRFLWMRYRICTGSILSRRWILSAGHCVMDSFARRFAMDAIVGAHRLTAITSSQIYSISYRVAHPMYRGDVGPYDISMMKTSHRIEYSQNVQPIRLPIMNPQFNRNEKLLITGWGALQASLFYTVLPNKLQEVHVTYLPYDECYRAVNHLLEYHEHNPLRKMANICTGPISGGIAGCTGDSGAPLVRYIPYVVTEVTTPTEAHGIDEQEEINVVSSSSPIPMTTDRPTTGSTSSPIPMTTDRTSTTSTGNTFSPIPVSTDRPSKTTVASTFSPIPMTTDRTSTTTTGNTPSPIPMTTDRTSTTTTGNTPSPIPISTDRPFTTTRSTSSPIPMTTDRSQKMATEISYVGDLRIKMVPTVIGVLSWGVVPCGKRGAPTVYSNVTNYLDFINKYLSS